MNDVRTAQPAHSPGPWAPYKNGRKLGRGKNAPASWDVLNDGGTDFICDRVTEANARLIAAAPAMLEALKALRKPLAGLNLVELDRANAAIAQAEGGEV